MKNNILEIKNLSFAYLQQEVLQDINLEVAKDNFLAIIGNPQKELKCIHIAGTKGKGSRASKVARDTMDR